jgi:hypothetical protein
MSSEMEKQSTVESLTKQLQAAEAEIEELGQKTAEYIESTQPLLDKQAAAQQRFEKRATEVAGVLVDRGIIPPAESALLVEKLAEDSTRALDLVARLARMVGPDRLAKQADVQAPTGRRLDGFEALVLTGDPSNTNPTSPLNVE